MEEFIWKCKLELWVQIHYVDLNKKKSWSVLLNDNSSTFETEMLISKLNCIAQEALRFVVLLTFFMIQRHAGFIGHGPDLQKAFA